MNEALMRRAIELAITNVHSGLGGPFSALVARGGEILGEGTNLVTSTHDPTAHAEVVAIRAACRRLQHFELTGCDIYATCEPCPMCLGAIYWARPARIFYACSARDAAAIGFDDLFIYEQFAVPPEQRRIPMTQHLRDDGLRAFRAWSEKPDKIQY